MDEPTITDRELIDIECTELARKIAPLVLQDLQLGIPAEDTPHGRALVAAVYRAVDDLEGQGARSDRVAYQLLEALTRYALALGELLIEGEEPEEVRITECWRVGAPERGIEVQHLIRIDDPAPTYRIEWCTWVDGFGADQQDWIPSEFCYSDEYEANTMRERCDERFKTISIRHRVVEIKA